MSATHVAVLDAELADLDDLGLLINDRQAAEHVFRPIGALVALQETHGFDAAGRCRRCRPGSWYRRRRPCTVYDALREFGIGQADRSEPAER